MFAFFMAHIYLEKHRGDLALQAMEKLHKIFPTSVHLYTHVSHAVLHVVIPKSKRILLGWSCVLLSTFV